MKRRTRQLLIFVIIFATSSHCFGQEGSHLVKNTDGNLVKCPYTKHSCSEWIIDWRTPAGNIWGIDTSGTEEGVKHQRDFTIAFERSYAKFSGKEMDPKYLNPSEPYCKFSCGKGSVSVKVPELSGSADEIVGRFEAMWLADAWKSKVQSAGIGFIKRVISDEPSKGLPNTKFGSVTKEYASTLKKIRETAMRIQRFTHDLSVHFSSVVSMIDRFKVELDQSGTTLLGKDAASEVRDEVQESRKSFLRIADELYPRGPKPNGLGVLGSTRHYTAREGSNVTSWRFTSTATLEENGNVLIDRTDQFVVKSPQVRSSRQVRIPLGSIDYATVKEEYDLLRSDDGDIFEVYVLCQRGTRCITDSGRADTEIDGRTLGGYGIVFSSKADAEAALVVMKGLIQSRK
jgi:hypothetical protein